LTPRGPRRFVGQWHEGHHAGQRAIVQPADGKTGFDGRLPKVMVPIVTPPTSCTASARSAPVKSRVM
jgi:hypothetical protein